MFMLHLMLCKLLVFYLVLLPILMESIIFSSINTNGFRDVSKQSNIFHFIKRHKFNVTFLQETHLTAQEETSRIFKTFSGKHYHSFGTNNSKGVSILISDNFEANENTIIRDNEVAF